MVGVFGLASAFDKPKVIKKYMTDHNIKFNEIANNIVFCLSNHKNRNAGSKLLSMVRKDAILWWFQRYNDILKAFQTFILPPRLGTVYYADNWEKLGETTGKSEIVRTIPKSEYEQNKDYYNKQHIEIKTFKSGEVRYLIREFITTEPKIILVKLNDPKKVNSIINRMWQP